MDNRRTFLTLKFIKIQQGRVRKWIRFKNTVFCNVCDAMQQDRQVLVFQKSVLPPSSLFCLKDGGIGSCKHCHLSAELRQKSCNPDANILQILIFQQFRKIIPSVEVLRKHLQEFLFMDCCVTSAITWSFSVPDRKYTSHKIEMETDAPEPADEGDIRLKYFRGSCAAQVQEQ